MELLAPQRRAAWREEIKRMRDAWGQLSENTRNGVGDAGMLYSQAEWLVERLELALLNLDVVMQRPVTTPDDDAR